MDTTLIHDALNTASMDLTLAKSMRIHYDFYANVAEYVRRWSNDRRYRLEWLASAVTGTGEITALMRYRGVKYYAYRTALEGYAVEVAP